MTLVHAHSILKESLHKADLKKKSLTCDLEQIFFAALESIDLTLTIVCDYIVLSDFGGSVQLLAMPPKKAAAKPGIPAIKRGGKVYSRPEPIASGEVLTDICGKRWKIGKSVGVGGFGEIYLASDETGRAVTDKANYVIKIEPHDNGPLFVEISVYIRVAKLEMIEEWKKLKKNDNLGMPWYVTSGLHDYKSDKYRFMVIPRFGPDLHKLLMDKPGKRFNIKTVQAIALQVTDTLEYIHSKDYIHGDIKASNLLLGLTSKKNHQQVYLLDYGLASKYLNSDRIHVPYTPDLRKAHNGTLEYTSRDAHIGAFSRRGDLEILGYNLLEWTFGKLPWSADDTPENVAKQKNAFMAQMKSNGSLRKIYPTSLDIPGLDILESYIRYVAKLDFDEEPNYKHCKELLKKGLTKYNSLYLDEVATSTPPKSKSGGSKLKRVASAADALDGSSAPVVVPKKIRIPDEDDLPIKRATRKNKKILHKRKENMSTPPMVGSRSRSPALRSPDDTTNRTRPTRGAHAKKRFEDKAATLVNPTPAMLQVLAKTTSKRK
ncbi:unnamed protein product [Allacma fusca]|uniref:non-specific serine/threonine protein kinase n=1 Tax=Allacma fusca TaxID=39272 RepID=A0A8J2LR18_9HEXA|nr:unnamed protein product [Allacma fusca]